MTSGPELVPPPAVRRAVWWIRVGALIQIGMVLLAAYGFSHSEHILVRIWTAGVMLVIGSGVVVEEIVVHALCRRRAWAWIGGLVVAVLETGTLLVPIAVMVLIHLLHPETRAWFAAESSPEPSPGPPRP